MTVKANTSLDEIVNEIIGLIRPRDELGGHFQQEPYKGDFFQLFVAAWNAGLFSPTAPKNLKLDSLTSIIEARDPDVFDSETWSKLSAAWPEWQYAWAHARL